MVKTDSRAAIRKPARPRASARGERKFNELPTRLTAELAPAVDEDGEVVPGIRFFLDGEALRPEDTFEPGDDEETAGAKVQAYLRRRGVQDPQELFLLMGAWHRLYFAPSYALPSC